MIVHELIDILRGCDKDAIVEILVESKEDSFDTTNFEIVNSSFRAASYLTLKVVPVGHLVVDESSYEDLKAEKLESDDLVEKMSSVVEEMEQKINEFESGE